MSLTGEIRKITWGTIPHPQFSIEVDQFAGGKARLKVIQIVKELNEDSGKFEFHVECHKQLKDAIPNVSNAEYGPAFIWKTYHKMPDEVEYFTPDELHNYKKV